MTAGMKKREQATFEYPLVQALAADPANSYELLARGPSESADQSVPSPDFDRLWSDASSIAERERFLHWQVAFPGVWQGWQDASPSGGFDAVIGNPPWDHIEQPEVEWFALRDDEIALASTGAIRKALIKRRQDAGDELALQFEEVKRQARELRQLARTSGQYPQLSGGRINLYSLFVERATGLVKPDGFVGCSRRRASTPTRRRRGSSSRSRLADGYRRSSTLRTAVSELGCRRFSQTLILGSSSAC